MKQLLQHRRRGTVAVADVPQPRLRDGGVLVQTRASLISAGTERAALELSRKSLPGMARERPDLVARVLEKLRRDGLAATMATVRDQLDRQVPLGYSTAGEVVAVGRGAPEFAVGARVACAGAGYASHAEVNFIPRLLATSIPEGVSDEQAAYATVGAIALQGVRNADVRVGETVAVIGLGLIGQLAVQILRAAGCRVVGLDPSAERAALARQCGADLAVGSDESDADALATFTRGRGADAVLIAAATKSNGPIDLAARIARDRARVVMVGVTGMELPRAEFYHKELTFIVSRSYGPGRYDRDYEEHGHDYPIGHVRWTENRNLEAFLELVAGGTVRPERLTTHRFPIERATEAYELVLGGGPHLGILLEYPQRPEEHSATENGRILLPAARRSQPLTGALGISFIGAGNFARGVLLRHLAKRSDVSLRGVVTASGASARSAGERFGFAYCASDVQELLADDQTHALFVCTRHSKHASLVAAALRAGKAVFVEKPLAVTPDQLRDVAQALKESAGAKAGRLMVGFNRRFAPFAAELKTHFTGTGPLTMHYRCNAGGLPADHWLLDPEEGGRIIGEGCHFLDFFSYLTEAEPVSVSAVRSDADADNASITISYSDGSVGHLLYVTRGATAAGKELVEIFGGGRTAVLDDFRRLTLYAGGRTVRNIRRFRQEKGHAAELAAFVAAVRNGDPMPIPAASLFQTTLATFAAVEAAALGAPVAVADLAADL